MKRLSLGKLLVLNTYWLGLSFMWNSLHVIILPAILINLVPEEWKNTYLGLLTLVGLLIAMVVQPISGTISDGWVSPWGRRRPLILIGTSFDFLFLVFLAWSGGILWVAIGYIGLQLSSNIAHGPLQGLLPDIVAEEQLGRASGLKNFMDMAGLVAAALVMGRIMEPGTSHPVVEVSLIGLILATSAGITLTGVREKPTLKRFQATSPMGGWKAFQDALRRNRGFAWLILSRFIFLIGVIGVQVYAQYYLRDVLAFENPARSAGDLLAVITIALVISAVAGGWLSDRYGQRPILLVACLVGASGFFAMTQVRSMSSLIVIGSIIGGGIGLFMTSNWALANDLAPAEEAGKYMGLTNLATAGAGIIGRLEGPLIDLLNNARPGTWSGYIALFLVGAIFMLISAMLLAKIPEHRPT